MECRVITDLLPLYHDEVASDESRSLVEEHLSTCEECRRTLTDIHEGLEEGSHLNEPVNGLKALRGKLRRKTLISVITSIVIAALFVSTVAYVVFFHQGPVSASEVTQSITHSDSAQDVLAQMRKHKMVEILFASDSMYVVVSDTVWTRFFSPTRPDSVVFYSLDSHDSTQTDIFGLPAVVGEDPHTLIDAARKIYYLEGDLDTLSRDREAFEEAARSAVLLWEK